MRSRLEAKYASLFDAFGWRWSYEPLDFPNRIPDFLLHFRHPLIIEVKPALSIDEITGLRRDLTSVAMDWMIKGAQDELDALDTAPDAADDLERADECNAFIDDLRERGDVSLWYRGRKALVVGSRLFEFRECFTLPSSAPPADVYGVGAILPPDGVTVDGWHYLTSCNGHVGLHNQRECLVCGLEGPGEIRSSVDVHEAWIEAGNAAQWRPPA